MLLSTNRSTQEAYHLFFLTVVFMQHIVHETLYKTNTKIEQTMLAELYVHHNASIMQLTYQSVSSQLIVIAAV